MPASALAIQQTFSRAALSYDRSASVQAKVAELLLEKLLVNSNSLISGPVVEIGCGTGLVSSRLVKQFPERDFVFSDLSDSMLSSCRQRLEESGLATSRQSFLNVNAEDDL
jgi:malonyl-CoA O-methyltransferase